MAPRSVTRTFIATATIASLLAFSISSDARNCSETRVRKLAKEGNTVTRIADQCELTKRKVNEILDAQDGHYPDNRNYIGNQKEIQVQRKFRRGQPVGDCGCWGAADARYRQPHIQCESGFAEPKSCNFACPLGGLAWQGVCS